MSEGNVNWEELAASMAEIEAEFEAEDNRDPEAKAAGIPLWAYRSFLSMKGAWEDAEERGDDNLVEWDQAVERFAKTYVSVLGEAGARIAWDGEPSNRGSALDGRLTLELEGRAAFVLFMALRVAFGACNTGGPLALIPAGLIPNVEDAAEISLMSGALADTLLMQVQEGPGEVNARANA